MIDLQKMRARACHNLTPKHAKVVHMGSQILVQVHDSPWNEESLAVVHFQHVDVAMKLSETVRLCCLISLSFPFDEHAAGEGR